MNGLAGPTRDFRTSFIDVDSEEEYTDVKAHADPVFTPAALRPNAPISPTMHFEQSSTLPSDPTGSPLVKSRLPFLPYNPSSNDLPDPSAPHHSEDSSSSSRWSHGHSYSSSVRSRSNSNAQPIKDHPYDALWRPADERDELTLSEYDTEDDLLDDPDHEDEDLEDESTSAIRLAENGTGRIVQANGVGISQLRVDPGTTHLLLGSSPTHAMPSFLTNHLPQISSTLLVLDISANFLDALPPVLAMCVMLEELNIASNPLRVLPVFLADLTNLRVLIADATGLSSVPETLVDLDLLHTLSLRRNKMTCLPSWLCLLPALQALYIDGNPFQGPWEALIKPLLVQVPSTPVYPLSTPVHPLPSAGAQSSIIDSTDGTDTDSSSEPPSATLQVSQALFREEEDHTITPDKAQLLSRPPTDDSSPLPSPRSGGLVRTRTTPNRASRPNSRVKSSAQDSIVGPPSRPASRHRAPEDSGYFGDHEIRKMKSAGDLRRPKSTAVGTDVNTSARPALQHYATSASSANLLSTAQQTPDSRPAMQKRFASLSSAATLGNSPSPPRRPGVQSVWDKSEVNYDSPSVAPSPHSNRISFTGETSPPRKGKDDTVRSKEKGGRWGFLKKMSMGKMKQDPPAKGLNLSSKSMRRPQDPSNTKPLIDTRISTTGNLDFGNLSPPRIEASDDTSQPASSASTPASVSTTGSASPGMLSPTAPSIPGRTTRRRSFLPIDAPLSIPIPDSSPFVGGVTVTQDGEVSPNVPSRQRTPSPDPEAAQRREEERAREAYKRALRSVMAYLKDMNDLSLSQQAVANPYVSPTDELPSITRPRRPTASEITREASSTTTSTTGSHSSDASSQLRSKESIAALRSGTSSRTNSVADSIGSNEERKWKDDKGKRMMVVREIVHTERTYVKGLLELSEIYIKPSTTTVNVLSGVSSSKETVLPPSERKAVFGGLDALISFHKDIFLPALESAAAPLLKNRADADPDGALSADVANAVGNMFFKHVAFMRMYSTYINNFDNAVQHVKAWTSDRTPHQPSIATSPSSSTVQLASAVSPENSGSTGPHLTSSQRKRIRSYLKRARMNPRHSQLNLEGYLLLPVQRIPRYRLLLEELVRSTPPTNAFMSDPLDRALAEISSLASNMNEGKREAESRRKLVQWQSRIRGKFPSPLVQPHRRLIMDGPLMLTRVVRKAVMTYDSINAQGDKSVSQVDCLAPELTPRALVGILCNDLLVLCRDLSEGTDGASPVDLWAVLRMQTLPQPASIVHGNSLRLVDNKAILYFDTPSPSDALNWYRAINLHIPASKT